MSDTLRPELHLFVIWSSAMPLADRMLADMARRLEIVWRREFPIEGRARDFYRRFYAHMRLDGKRKEKSCGKGPYLLVVVRDSNPEYVKAPNGIAVNRTMRDLKSRYREWARRGYRVHGTLTREEFARDIEVLTGHSAAEWALGVPDGAIGPCLPPLASLPPVPGILERIRLRRAQKKACAKKRKRLSKRIRAAWWDVITSEGSAMGLLDCRVLLENKLVNDIFFEGTFKGEPCIVKCSSRAPESIENEYRMSRRLAAVAPVCAEALALWRSPDGRRAFVVTRKLPGPSLAGILAKGVGEEEAIGVLEDMIRIAEALIKSGIVWRDIIPDNFMRDSDGHLKLIDAQFAVDRNDFREDPFLLKNWSYRMIVFAHHPMTAGYGWNDAAMMLVHVLGLSDSARARELRDRLLTMCDASNFAVEYGGMDRFRMRIALAVMRMQRVFAGLYGGNASLDMRIGRAEAFLKRDCDLWKKALGIRGGLCTIMKKERVYIFRNAAGRPVRAFTDKFFDIEPELAERLCPVSRDRLDKYCVMREVNSGEVAWLYAPYKVDKVTTVFFVQDGRCYVKKVLEKRAWRWRKSIFVQHGMPPTPIYRGPTARDVMTPAIERGDVEEVKRQVIRFLDELMAAYPPIRRGVLPECTCDAIPQNCVIDAAGKYHFFDLEGDMTGGVPLAYLIYRIADTTISRTPKKPGVWLDTRRIVLDIDRHYGVEPDNKAHAAITRELKRYSTFSVGRVLTNIWMSLLPFKSWKRRFRWWARTPMLLD